MQLGSLTASQPRRSPGDTAAGAAAPGVEAHSVPLSSGEVDR